LSGVSYELVGVGVRRNEGFLGCVLGIEYGFVS